MFEPSHARDTIRNSIATGYRDHSKAGIRYRHMAALGGLRHVRRDSINAGWRNASFRGFADYMQTPEFQKALDQLIKKGEERRTAIMCAEAVPWRCHRSLIGDALLVRGLRVEEIASLTRTRPHRLTPWARVRGKQLSYPVDSVDVMDTAQVAHVRDSGAKNKIVQK
jgi:uncharacterized protein (DUF488 family)